jgi:hypothetical protein
LSSRSTLLEPAFREFQFEARGVLVIGGDRHRRAFDDPLEGIQRLSGQRGRCGTRRCRSDTAADPGALLLPLVGADRLLARPEAGV